MKRETGGGGRKRDMREREIDESDREGERERK